MTFGEKIQFLRKNAGLSQSEFAEKIEISRQSVSKWESDACLPDTEKVILISRLFSVSIDDLLDEKREISVYYYDNNGEFTDPVCKATDNEEQNADFEHSESEVSASGCSETKTNKSKKIKRLLRLQLLFVCFVLLL